MVVVELAIIVLVHLVLVVGVVVGIRATQSVLAGEPGAPDHDSHGGPEGESAAGEPGEAA